MLQKRFYYKVYDSQGKFLSVWSKEVIVDPSFRTVINGGAGELKLTLARPYDNYGEGVDVSLGNRVEVWVADNDNISNNLLSDTNWDQFTWDVDLWDSPIRSFIKIYSGYISAYSPILDDEKQYVDITVLGYVTEASYRVIRDSSGNTTLTYTSKDPGYIMRDIIDKYRADGGVNINYSGTSIAFTGQTVTYTFQYKTLKEILDKIIQLCPDGWFWYIDSNGIVWMSQSSEMADHQVVIGQDISYMSTNKRIENLRNVVYVVGGGTTQLFNRYERAGSINSYGKFEYKLQDGKVLDNATSDIMAKRILDKFEIPETRTVLRIIDNNGEGPEGDNIEDYKVGDTIQIKNLNYGKAGSTSWDLFTWDVGVWDSSLSFSNADVLTIVSVSYKPDYIEIEASSRLPEITKRVEDIKLIQDQLLSNNIPTAPTSRSV